MTPIAYGPAIRQAFEWLLANRPEVFTIGQGLWSPWYVGNSMTALDKKFGVERVIDTPVSELATTGAALGAALCGYRPVVIHPRVDFMLLAVDQIVNQTAKWRSMFGGQVAVPLTVRAIINRGGEQGAHGNSLRDASVAAKSIARRCRPLKLCGRSICGGAGLSLVQAHVQDLGIQPDPGRRFGASGGIPAGSRTLCG